MFTDLYSLIGRSVVDIFRLLVLLFRAGVMLYRTARTKIQEAPHER